MSDTLHGKETEPGKVKGTVWVWAAIGAAAGAWLGAMVFGTPGALVAGCVVGVLAYRSSRKAGGGAPSWLWRSKQK